MYCRIIISILITEFYKCYCYKSNHTMYELVKGCYGNDGIVVIRRVYRHFYSIDVMESCTKTNNHAIIQSGCSLMLPQITCTLAPVNFSIRVWILITEKLSIRWISLNESYLFFFLDSSMILRYLILTCRQYWLAHTIRGKSLRFSFAILIMFETCNLASPLAKDLRSAPKNFGSNRWKFPCPTL